MRLYFHAMRDDGLSGEGIGEGMAGSIPEAQVQEDLTAISKEELGALLGKLVSEEREISYRRRILQGKIDLVRAELVRRGGVTIPPEDLARVLMGERIPDRDEEGGAS